MTNTREYVSNQEASDIATSLGYKIISQSRSYLHKDEQSASGFIIKDSPSNIDDVGALTSILISSNGKIHFLYGKKFYE